MTPQSLYHVIIIIIIIIKIFLYCHVRTYDTYMYNLYNTIRICFGIAQDSYVLAHTLSDINIINTWVEKNYECTYDE